MDRILFAKMWESAVDVVRDGCLVVTSVSHMHGLLNAGFEWAILVAIDNY